MKKKILSIIAIGFLTITANIAEAAIIDFDDMPTGNGLTAINSSLYGLGVQFSAGVPSEAYVVSDPTAPSNNVLRVKTWPPLADLLINFSNPINYIRVEFRDNPDDSNIFNSLAVYSDNETTASTASSTNRIGTVTGEEPNYLEYYAPEIFAVQLESFSGQFFIDNIEYNPVPVPGAIWLLGSGLAGLAGLRRKKK